MADIRVADTTVKVESSCHMYGMIDLNIQSYDPSATMTSFQARQLAMALIDAADEADGVDG